MSDSTTAAVRDDRLFIGADVHVRNSYWSVSDAAGKTVKRGRVGNTLGDVRYDEFARMLGGYGEEVRDPADIRPALERARESGKPSLINVWVDPEVYAPGTMNQTMYK